MAAGGMLGDGHSNPQRGGACRPQNVTPSPANLGPWLVTRTMKFQELSGLFAATELSGAF